MWGNLPYITKDELHRVIGDLRDEALPGRSGMKYETPLAARVCRTDVRDQLRHLQPDIGKDRLANISSKYRNLPDNYYGGESEKFVSPDKLSDSIADTVQYNIL